MHVMPRIFTLEHVSWARDDVTGISIKRILAIFRPMRSAGINSGEFTTGAGQSSPPGAAELLQALTPGGH